MVNAFFTGMLDGLLSKYRNPESMFGPYSEINFSNFAHLMAKTLTSISYILVVGSVLSNNELSVNQKIDQIIANLLATIGILKGTNIAFFLLNPIAATIASIIVTVIMAVIFMIISESLFSQLFRQKYLYTYLPTMYLTHKLRLNTIIFISYVVGNSS